jgi:hypothetical protein
MANKDSSRIDLVNIGLVILSCIAAYLFPLELLVFSFVVLGPLHYLTEISWLEKRGFFVRERFDYFFLVAMCLAIAILQFFKLPFSRTVPLAAALGCAIAFFFLSKTAHKIIAAVVICALAFFSREVPLYVFFFGVLLPTLIHVYVFTGLFILYGALKNRSMTGYLSLLVFAACSIVFFIFNPLLLGVSEYTFLGTKTPVGTGLSLTQFLGVPELGFGADTPTAEAGRIFLRFAAFAYTYHYLNWFSKTSVIQWHKVSRWRLGAVIVLWIFFVGFHAVNFRAGLFLLTMLSIGHVLLELPLNYQTILGIGSEIKKMTRVSMSNSAEKIPTSRS